MTDVNGRTIIVGDKVIIKSSYGDTFELATVTGFTPKKIKVDAQIFTGGNMDRNISKSLVVTDKPADVVAFLLNGFNKLA